jgi:hypothetical protein
MGGGGAYYLTPRPAVVPAEATRNAASEVYRAVLVAQGATAQADEFFAQLEARLRSGMVNLAPGAGPRPCLDGEDLPAGRAESPSQGRGADVLLGILVGVSGGR